MEYTHRHGAAAYGQAEEDLRDGVDPRLAFSQRVKVQLPEVKLHPSPAPRQRHSFEQKDEQHQVRQGHGDPHRLTRALRAPHDAEEARHPRQRETEHQPPQHRTDAVTQVVRAHQDIVDKKRVGPVSVKQDISRIAHTRITKITKNNQK